MAAAAHPRAVITDFGGVLTTPLADAFEAYHRRSGIPAEDLRNAMTRAAEEHGGHHPLFELERGTITEDEFLRRLEGHLQEGASLDGFREVYFEHLHPNQPMIDAMRALRARGLRTAMLTNNVREWEPIWRGKIPDVDELFDPIVDSAFVGMRKPEPEIYRLTVERLGDGLEASDCLFVDDLEVNCRAAVEVGMRAVHFRANDQALAEIEAAVG